LNPSKIKKHKYSNNEALSASSEGKCVLLKEKSLENNKISFSFFKKSLFPTNSGLLVSKPSSSKTS
jgi:hypothetical protein